MRSSNGYPGSAIRRGLVGAVVLACAVFTLHAADDLVRAATTADEFSPTLSPDGRWLAYVSGASGREEIPRSASWGSA